MAQTTLPVRRLRGMHAPRPHWAANIVLLSIIIATASTMTSCGSGGDSGTAGADGVPTGQATASLAWDPVPDVVGYYIHYGIRTPEAQGSCAYDQSTFSSTPDATLTGLAENTTYYFAVSAFNGVESLCSDEISTVTGSV